ncbi:hypothetical protein EV190_12241 [Actinorugispora endophytica]|uniref:Uncharacterized protein n=1 Tax=Actinorugispora endophytica TaxID=1605990 RepID=A0A4R6UKT4_9ACTN|nr:hypothetical protein EV190_12241 [Actinorugispora endophytica]
MRWPAYAMAVLFLGYAVGKGLFAARGRLGFPGGPVVPASEYERYARMGMDVEVVQWFGVPTGLLAAALVLVTVTAAGRRVPRPLVLLALAGMLAAVGAGAAFMVVDGFVGIGIGWQWYHGVLGIAVVGLLTATIRSYARSSRPGAGRRAPVPGP